MDTGIITLVSAGIAGLCGCTYLFIKKLKHLKISICRCCSVDVDDEDDEYKSTDENK